MILAANARWSFFASAIKDYRFDTAVVHDSRHIDDLIIDERHSVWADSAYMDSKRWPSVTCSAQSRSKKLPCHAEQADSIVKEQILVSKTNVKFAIWQLTIKSMLADSAELHQFIHFCCAETN